MNNGKSNSKTFGSIEAVDYVFFYWAKPPLHGLKRFRSVECKSFNVELEMSRARYIYFITNFKMLCIQVILVSLDLDTKFRCLCAREVKDIRQVNLRRISRSTAFVLGTALLKFDTPK